MSAEIPPHAKRRRMQERGLAARLRTALSQLAEQQATILTHSEKNWASVTFSGTRHRLELEFAGPEAVEAGERFIAALPDHEFTLAGQLVADATVEEVDHVLLPEPRMAVTVGVLLLEDG